MNFFGHAVVASQRSADPRFVLGSMVPDFESMIRMKVRRVADSVVADGVSFHHETDSVFHRTPSFVAIGREALAALTSVGVRRGTARAVAHLGAEMFLDGWLAHREPEPGAYEGSLAHEHVSSTLQWHDEGLAFGELHARLVELGTPTAYGDPDFVMERLVGALADRPRLRVEPSDATPVRQFLATLQGLVEATAPEMLHELEKGLGCFDE